LKILAIDYGDARTGMAVSDATGFITGSAWTINEYNFERVAEKTAAAALEHGAELIVLGCPRNMDGSYGPRAEKSRALAELIRAQCPLEVILWDERLTTVDAHRILSETGRHGKKRKQKVDAVAASLILESYLDSLR